MMLYYGKLHVISVYTHTHALDLPAYEEQAACVSIETFDHPSLLIGCAHGGGALTQTHFSRMTCNCSNLHVTETILISPCHNWDYMTVQT